MRADEEIVAVAMAVGRALEAAAVEYALGGSVASSLQGEPRATRDIDFAVHLEEAQIPALIRAFGDDFAIDEEELIDAVRRGRSANIFHLPTVTKVDLFVRGGTAFDRSELSRRLRIEVAGGALFVATPEDNLLRKLAWFRMGGEVSDQQWRDVLGLVRIGGPALDRTYLERWAPLLGVTDLLHRALASG